MEEVKLLHKADLDNTAIIGYLERIKMYRPFLYQLLYQAFDVHALRIRADVLAYIADSIDEFKDDKDYELSILSLIGNVNIGPEWYEWINCFLNTCGQTSIGDFFVVLLDAIEKRIPFQEIRRMFDSEEGDILRIYEKVDAYTGEESTIDEEAYDADSDSADPNVSESLLPSRAGFVDVFEDLATVMGAIVREDTDLLKMQNEFNSILTNLQTIATGIFREWQKDKDAVIRMNALHRIHQRFLLSQQTKINCMRKEIDQLKNQIRAAEKLEKGRDVINQKILELEKLLRSSETTVLDDSMF